MKQLFLGIVLSCCIATVLEAAHDYFGQSRPPLALFIALQNQNNNGTQLTPPAHSVVPQAPQQSQHAEVVRNLIFSQSVTRQQ